MNLVMISNGKIILIDYKNSFFVLFIKESFRVMQQRIERLFCLMKRRYLIDIIFNLSKKIIFFRNF
jgi:hypothetical protein